MTSVFKHEQDQAHKPAEHKVAEAGRHAAGQAVNADRQVADRATEAGRHTADKAAEVARTATRETVGVAQQAARSAQQTVQSGVNAATEAGQRNIQAGADVARRGAETAQQMAQSGLKMITEMVERSREQSAQAFGFSARDGGQGVQALSRNVETITASSAILAQGAQDISREWVNLAQDRLRRNLDGFNALLGCRSFQDVMSVQTNMVRDNLEQTVANGRRIAELSVKVAYDVGRKMAAQAGRPHGEVGQGPQQGRRVA